MKPTPAHLSRFIVRRDAYAVQRRDGSYLARKIADEFDPAPTLDADLLQQHLDGKICLGVYTIIGTTCCLFALDIDGKDENPENAKLATLTLAGKAMEAGIPALVEYTGKKGYRLWWLTERIPAALARTVAFGLMDLAGEQCMQTCQEVVPFPKQSGIEAGAFGNLLKLPWGKRPDNNVRSVFCKPANLDRYPLSAQAEILEAAPTYTRAQLLAVCDVYGWDVKKYEYRAYTAPEAAPREKEGILKRDAHSPLPCYLWMTSDNPPTIPSGHRNNALHALGCHEHRMGNRSQRNIELSLHSFNKHCAIPLAHEDIGKIAASIAKQTHVGAHCEVIQKAGFCSALARGEVCPIFEKQQEAKQETAAQLAQDDAIQLSLSPLSILRTSPPIYTATVKGVPVKLRPDQLLSFSKFQEACMQVTDFVPTLPEFFTRVGGKIAKGDTWLKVVNAALEGLIEEDAPPEDASINGVVWGGVKEFFNTCRRCEEREAILHGDAFVEDGYIHFRGRDLIKHLKVSGFFLLPPPEFWNLLRSKGASPKQLKVKGDNQTVWTLPLIIVDEDRDSLERDEAVTLLNPPRGMSAAFQTGWDDLKDD